MVQILRQYQLDCIDAIMLAWSKKPYSNIFTRAGINAATGAGKTSILSELLRRVMKPDTQRALVVAHTTEIIDQLYSRIKNQFAELKPFYLVNDKLVPGIGIVRNTSNIHDARLVVATRQSLTPKRLTQILESGAIDYLIYDEAHHDGAGNGQYREIETTLRLANPDIKKAGFSATWTRQDRKALGASYDEICYNFTILDGVKLSVLVPPSRLQIKSGVDLSGVGSVAGDYSKQQLASILDASNWADLAVEAFITYIRPTRKHTMAFLYSVGSSITFVEALQSAGVNAAHIDGTTPKEIRKDILARYANGEIQVLSNFMVLGEGVDIPDTDSIVWARPTRSEVVLTQAIGRGLRPSVGKVDCLVLDLAAKDTRALQAGTLAGKMKVCPNCKVEYFYGFNLCPSCGYDVTAKLEPLETPVGSSGGYSAIKSDLIMSGLHAEIVPILDGCNAAWFRDNDNYMSCGLGFKEGALVIIPPTYKDNAVIRDRIQRGLYLLENELITPDVKPELLSQIDWLRIELSQTEQYTLWYISKDRKTVEYLKSNSDATSLISFGDSEAWSRLSAGERIQINRNANWRFKLASDGQKNYLHTLQPGTLKENITSGECAALITHLVSVPGVIDYMNYRHLEAPDQKG